MCKVLLLLLLAFCCFFQSISCDCFGVNNEKSYQTLEKLMVKEVNIKRLQDSFHPTNLHSKRIVSVTYDFLNITDSSSPTKVCFYWLASPVHLMTNKEMLHGLSLMTYMPENSSLVVPLNISEVCQDDYEDVLQDLDYIKELKDSNNRSELCNGNIKLLEVLNNFTTNVSCFKVNFKSCTILVVKFIFVKFWKARQLCVDLLL